MTNAATQKQLPPSQQAALARVTREKSVDWTSTTPTEARAFNALVEKGLVKKTTDRFTRYELV